MLATGRALLLGPLLYLGLRNGLHRTGVVLRRAPLDLLHPGIAERTPTPLIDGCDEGLDQFQLILLGETQGRLKKLLRTGTHHGYLRSRPQSLRKEHDTVPVRVE